jgi:hypothetical protein
MNVVRTKSSRSASLLKAKVENQPTTVNLYQEIPNFEVSLDDFEEYALDRLKVCIRSQRYSTLCLFKDDLNLLLRFAFVGA